MRRRTSRAPAFDAELSHNGYGNRIPLGVISDNSARLLATTICLLGLACTGSALVSQQVRGKPNLNHRDAFTSAEGFFHTMTFSFAINGSGNGFQLLQTSDSALMEKRT